MKAYEYRLEYDEEYIWGNDGFETEQDAINDVNKFINKKCKEYDDNFYPMYDRDLFEYEITEYEE